MLEVKRITKKFGKKAAVDDFSYTFEKGVYGILGPNGAGKTTLLRCIARLYACKQGEILFDEVNIEHDPSFLNHIGYLPQQFGLFRELTVTDMLKLMANQKFISAKDTAGRIAKCLKAINLEDRADSYIRELSGGMIRRLGIAQAMLSDPDVFLLDEPTAGLDPEERIRFKNITAKLGSKKTVILSTHIVSDVEALCDKLLIMDNGKLIAAGTGGDIASAARGKVFEAKETETRGIDQDRILKVYDRNNEKYVRFLSASSDVGIPCEPNIEDGYLCLLKNI